MSEFSIVTLITYFALVFIAAKPVISQVSSNKIQHLIFGCAASVSVLWWFRTGIYNGLDVHFLWLTALTLTLGWRWAIVSSAISLIVIASMGIISWHDVGVVGILGGIVPICFTFTAYIFAFHHLPKHFFVYIFFCSFFIGMCSIALKMLLFGGYFSYFGTYSWKVVLDNYLILIPLLLFPEGLLNGMTMTLLVIYKPDWVATFYDNLYLDDK